MTRFKNHLLIPAVVSVLGQVYSVESFAAQAEKRKTVGDVLSETKNKAQTMLPSSNFGFQRSESTHNLQQIKPGKSTGALVEYQGQGNKTEYEKKLDQQTKELFKLVKKFEKSPNKGEMWLRLAELYVEKANLIDSRKQDEYDAKLKDWEEKKTSVKPSLDQASAREYNRKAIQLYEWFLNEYPNDEKTPQALFFLGFNYFEIGEAEKGASFYEQLTKKYPNSQFTEDSHFALAEYYFENDKWAPAYKDYSVIIKNKGHRLHTFALYKGAWCLYRLGKTQQAINYLEHIIKTASSDERSGSSGNRSIDRSKLESEAIRDLVVFYTDGGDPEKADSYFKKLVGPEYVIYLEKVAYQYSAQGNRDGARVLFKKLIAQNPQAPKAFEYQYQIVQSLYYAKDTSAFKTELLAWIRDYGLNSAWYKANRKNDELLQTSNKLRETTLRNYVLQQHQTAQNSHAPFSQSQAKEGYQLYLQEFSDAPNIADMHFYYGELLYDMSNFDEAGIQYKWVMDNAPNSKFAGKAAQNIILSVERSVPTDEEMQKRVGNSLEPVSLDPKVERFISMANWYLEKYPTSERSVEIKFRVGRLYYQSNQFDPAIKIFQEIVRDAPKTKYAEYSANLLLDIYNLKKDFKGLEKTANDLLAVSSLAGSKAGDEIRGVVERASFKEAQDLETQKRFTDSAKKFELFAKKYPRSELVGAALFNAGVNFERSGMYASAIQNYRAIMSSKSSGSDKFKPKTQRLLAKLYQDTGHFLEAAQLYKTTALADVKDPLAANLMFNAAVLFESIGRGVEAIQCYNQFTQINKKKAENFEVLFSMASIHRKLGQKTAAIEKYKSYVETGGDKPDHLVESAYWVSELSKQQRAISKSDEWRDKAIKIFQRYSGKKGGNGSSFAAKLLYINAEKTFREMDAIKFPKNPAKQKEAADKKNAQLAKLESELVHIVKLDSAEEIINALALLGRAHSQMGQAIVEAPLPAGLSPEQTAEYKQGVQVFADKYFKHARESYKKAVERALELEVYNEGFEASFAYMNKQDPRAYYYNGEAPTDVRIINWMGL